MAVDIGLDAFSPLIDDLYQEGKTRSKIFFEGRATKAFKLKVHKHVLQLEKVKTLWQKEKVVNITDFYFPSKVEFPAETRKVESVDDLNADRSSLVIEGTQGQGKSIFLRYLAIQQLRIAEDPRIPIFVELKNCRADKGVKHLALAELRSMGFSPSPATEEYYFQCGKFILLLDAFDEIEEGIIGDVFNEVVNLVRQYDRTQTLITTRPESEITKSAEMAVLKLSPLQQNEIEPFLLKLGVATTTADELTKKILNSKTGIEHIVKTPLLLTLAAILYRSFHELPDTLSEFYKQLFNVLFSRHDRSKPGLRRPKSTKLNETDLRELFDAFSFISQSASKPRMDEIQFMEYCSRASSTAKLECDPSAFLKDIVSITCLMVRDGLEYAYVHRSVQEFHSASFVANSSAEFSKRFYGSLLGPRINTWRLTVDFLAEIDRLRWIELYAKPVRTHFLEQIGYSQARKSFDVKRMSKYIEPFRIGLIDEESGILHWRYPHLDWSIVDERLMNIAFIGTGAGLPPPLQMQDVVDNGIPFEPVEGEHGKASGEISVSSLLDIPRFRERALERLTRVANEIQYELDGLEAELKAEADKLNLLN